jgi:hypothetical protein
MARADSTPTIPAPLRALTMFDHVPDGCKLELVADDDSAPISVLESLPLSTRATQIRSMEKSTSFGGPTIENQFSK